MTEIRNAVVNTTDYRQFKEMILKEWDRVEQLPEMGTPYLLPMPLLAFSDNIMVGGLSFIYYKNPENESNAIWINTVYIDENFRGKGIASVLISKAEEVLLNRNLTEVFVFSDKPNLYMKLDWEIVSEDKKNFVLKKLLHR